MLRVRANAVLALPRYCMHRVIDTGLLKSRAFEPGKKKVKNCAPISDTGWGHAICEWLVLNPYLGIQVRMEPNQNGVGASPTPVVIFCWMTAQCMVSWSLLAVSNGGTLLFSTLHIAILSLPVSITHLNQCVCVDIVHHASLPKHQSYEGEIGEIIFKYFAANKADWTRTHTKRSPSKPLSSMFYL